VASSECERNPPWKGKDSLFIDRDVKRIWTITTATQDWAEGSECNIVTEPGTERGVIVVEDYMLRIWRNVPDQEQP
jgi:hypothetical protein